MKQRKILLVSYEFPPIIGGAGVFAHDLALGLTKNDCKVEIATYYHGSESDQLKNELKNKFNIDLFFFKSIAVFHFIQYAFLIKKLLKKNSYDIVIVSDARAKKTFALFGVFFKIDYKKSLSVFHGNEINSFYKSPSLAIKIMGIQHKLVGLLKKQKVLVAVSENEERIWSSFFPLFKNKIKLIRHGVSDDIFFKRSAEEKELIKRELSIPTQNQILLSASRLVEMKGQDNLIKMFSLILKKNPNTSLYILGNGPFKANLEKLAVELLISEHVHFIGGVGRQVLSKFLSIADVFVLPSRLEESFGLVYIEAAACGVTSISGNLGGVIDVVVNNKTGLTVDPNNVNQLQEKILYLLNNENERALLCDKAYRNFKNGYTNQISAKNLLNGYYSS